MSRKSAFLAVAAAAVVTLAACANAGTVEDPKQSTGKKGEPVHLRFQSLAFAPTTVAQTKKAVKEWNDKHPKIQIQLTQGSWDNVHDQLVTQFQGGTAPDIVHDETADIIDFARQGNFADLKPYLSDRLRKGVSQDVWKSLTVDGKVVAAPTLHQTYVVFANKKAFDQAGVPVPSGASMSWDQFRSLAKRLKTADSYGVGWGMKQPTAAIVNLSSTFGGTWFGEKNGATTVDVGRPEMEVPTRIHAMAYKDKSIDPTSLTQGGTDVLPPFYAGKYSMVVAGSYVAQQITEQAPKGFEWVVLPPLSGTSAAQPASAQTLSVSASSKHVKEATEFIDYFTADENLSKLGQSDWLIPATSGGRDLLLKETGGENGWKQILASGESWANAPYLSAKDFPKWKEQTATPAFQRYLANDIDAGQLQRQLTDGWPQSK